MGITGSSSLSVDFLFTVSPCPVSHPRQCCCSQGSWEGVPVVDPAVSPAGAAPFRFLGAQGCPEWLWCHIQAAPHRDETGLEPSSCCGPLLFSPELESETASPWNFQRTGTPCTISPALTGLQERVQQVKNLHGTCQLAFKNYKMPRFTAQDLFQT